MFTLKVLEEAVALWINVAENNKIPITWFLIRQKALNYAEQLEISDFKASNGWMHRFAQRKSLRMHRIHGEAESAEEISFEIDRAEIERKLSSYSRENIYNFDETALSTLPHQERLLLSVVL